MQKFSTSRLLASAAIGMASWPTLVQAQVQNAAPQQQVDADTDYNTIIVSAQRRNQDLQDVPVTVTVFGADEIQNARIQQIDDVVTRTPGLSFDAYPPSQPRLFVRGIGTSGRGASGDPSSAVFVDDIYIGRPTAIAFDAFDVERIEVLKGPQGTLFGRNVVGGAINVITKAPDPSGVDASAEFTYGNYDQLEGAGFVNLPFAGNTGAIRVSGAYRTHDGFAYNANLDQNVDDKETLSGRLQFYGEPTDRLRVHFTLDGTRDRSTGPAFHALALDEEDPRSEFYTLNPDRDVTYGDTAGYVRRDIIGARGEIANEFDFGTLTFQAAYRDVDYSTRYDFDGGNPDPLSPGYNGINISGGDDELAELSSQELRLSSPSGSAVSWVAGLYHYHQRVRRDEVFTLDTALIAPVPLTDIYTADATTDSVAAFADVSVPLTDMITIYGGARYTRDKKTSRIFNTKGDALLRGDEYFDETASASFDAITYRAGVQFKPGTDHMFYASIANGFKSGGFQDDPIDADNARTPYEPEKAIQYEVGQKSIFFDGRVRWNNTLFYVDYTNLQTRNSVDGRSVVSNAGKARIKGYETELDLRPTDALALSIAYAYTDAKFVEFVEDEVDYAGNRLSRSPKHKLTVSPSYTYSFEGGVDVTLAADYRYESKIFDDSNNLPPETRDPTNFFDARLVIDNVADHFTFSIWGKNLTNEKTRVFQTLFLGADFGPFNPPRTYGATVRWKY